MTHAARHAFRCREDVIQHLHDDHEWRDQDTGSTPQAPPRYRWQLVDVDGRPIQSTDQLLAIHRELHALGIGGVGR